MADIIIGIILTAAVTAVIRKLRRDKKAGKSGCGGDCQWCGKNCGQSRIQKRRLSCGRRREKH